MRHVKLAAGAGRNRSGGNLDANTRQLEAIFDPNVFFQVPLFQRPYVWNEAENWDYLWEDIHALLDSVGIPDPEQRAAPAASLTCRMVPRFRLTTRVWIFPLVAVLGAPLTSPPAWRDKSPAAWGLTPGVLPA